MIHTPEQSRGEPSKAEAMGLCLGAACKLSFAVHQLENNANAESNTQEGIEPVRPCVSLFQAPLTEPKTLEGDQQDQVLTYAGPKADNLIAGTRRVTIEESIAALKAFI